MSLKINKVTNMISSAGVVGTAYNGHVNEQFIYVINIKQRAMKSRSMLQPVTNKNSRIPLNTRFTILKIYITPIIAGHTTSLNLNGNNSNPFKQ